MPIYEKALKMLADENISALKKLLNEEDLVDLVQLMRQLDPDLRVICFRLLNKDLAMDLFERLEVELQEELITDFAESEANETFKELAPDDRVRLLDELPARGAKKLLQNLSKEERDQTSELLGYEDETAGRMMTPEYVRFRQGTTVQEAIEKLRVIGDDKETIYNIYVTDQTRILEGTVSLEDLLMAEPDQKIEEIMDDDPIRVTTTMDQEEVARILQDQDMLAVPVVDNENRLVGLVTVDDALDVLEEETTEDIFEMAGLSALREEEAGKSRRVIDGSLPEIWRVRLPFLLIALAGGLMAGVVIEGFEDTLEAIAAVAIFIPVIMDMGGNVGTQSSTIFARGLVLGHINVRRFLRYFFKEMAVGITMGTLLGLPAGFIAYLWQAEPGFGLAVGISLALTVTLASTLGFLIPFILYKLNLDQAAGSDPIITTLKDITSLVIYFMSVQIFLSHLM